MFRKRKQIQPFWRALEDQIIKQKVSDKIYQSLIDAKIEIKEPEEPQEKWEKFKNTLAEAAEEHLPSGPKLMKKE